jgi:hypothetical protein
LKSEVRDQLADVAAAFLIGAALGVAATLLLKAGEPGPRSPRQPRHAKRVRVRDRDLRSVLATLRDR